MAQGFSLSAKGFNPANPYIEQDGARRVTGYWSLRHQGPRFPTRGLSQILWAMPYGMDVNAVYSPDGRTLRHIRISFLIL